MMILKKLDRILNFVEEWILIVTGTAVGSMILINALCRFLKIDWFGSEELTLFVAFWLYFTGSACAARDNTHISADMLELFTSNQRIRAGVHILRNLISIAICTTFTGWCFNYVMWQIDLGAKSMAYKLPVVISTLPILLSFFLWCLYLIRDLIRSVKAFSNSSHTFDPTKGDA